MLIAVDARIDTTEIAYAERLAAEVLGADPSTAARLVSESIARLVEDGAAAVRASIAARLRTPAEREVAYLAASGVIYRDGHLAHREAGSLAQLARTLDLDHATVDRLSTDERLTLGALYPLHWRMPPAAPPGKINEALEAWATERGLLDDPRAAATLCALDLETYQRFAFPRCSDVDALLWAAKYTLWLYLFDDAVEHFTVAADLAGARAFVAPCMEMPATGSIPPDAHPLIHTFAELTQELFAQAPNDAIRTRWVASHRRYWMQGILTEVDPPPSGAASVDRLRHDLSTRPWASGLEIYFDLGEVFCGAALPAVLHGLPEAAELRQIGALIGGVFNDLLSYDKEKPFENLANTALALRREFQLDDRGALTYAITLHNELVRTCDRRIDVLVSRGGERVAKYANMIRQMLHGLAAWQLQTRRYVNRHAVVISDGRYKNPMIDPDRAETLRRLASPSLS
jgi:hypothetical protein